MSVPSRVEGEASEPGLDAVVELAAAAARDLDGAVVFTSEAVPSHPVIVASAGIAEPDLAALASALLGAATPAGQATAQVLGAGEALAKQLSTFGFVDAVTAPVRLGRQAIGTFYLLRRSDSAADHGDLFDAYMRHAAVAIAGAMTDGETVATPRATLEALADLAVESLTFPGLIADLNGALEPIFGPVSCGIMLWDRDRDFLQLVAGSFGADEKTASSYQIQTINSRSNAARVFTTGDPYLTNEAAGDPAILQEWVEAFAIKHLATIRLEIRGRPIGVLHVLRNEGDFSLLDIRQLQRLSARVSGAVEAARTLALLTREKRLAEVLADAAVSIASGRGLREVLTAALTGLSDVLDAGLIVFVATSSEPVVWRRLRVRSVDERRLIEGARQNPPLHADITGPMRVGDPGSVLFHAPVELAGQRVGTLSTLRLRAEPFAADERDALQRLANLAALAWATERYQLQRAELARVEERQLIAADLHDDVAQILFAAQIALDSAVESEDLDPQVVANIVRARALVLKADEAIRSVIGRLSRPSVDDLVTGLATIAREVEDVFGLPARLEIADAAAKRAAGLSQPARDLLLKVARECLVNAAKHAGPCRAVVSLRLGRDSSLILAVVDDGLGAAGGRSGGTHYGLGSIRRVVRTHGGTLRVSSTPGAGTRVRLTLPI